MTRINTNVPSLIAQNRLSRSNEDLQTSLTRLSTGLRINSGKDDPAGLIASESLRSDITGINKAISNTQRASQIIATADSALGEVSSLLNDIRGLVVEAANNGALSDDEIAANQLQIDSSLEAINRIAQTTTFQGRRLLDGSLDFITQGGSGFGTVSDLKIDQANLGASGSVDVSINVQSAATRATVTTTGIATTATAASATAGFTFSDATPADEASGTVTLANAYVIGEEVASTIAIGTTIPDGEAGTAAGGQVSFANGFAFDIDVRDGAVPDGELGNDITINVTTSNVATESTGSYDAGTNTLNLVLVEGQSADAAVADLAADSNVNQIFDFSGGTVTAQATGTITLGTSAIEVTATAVAGEAADGAIGNSTTIRTFTSGNGGTDPTTATYDANTNTLDIYLADGLNAAALEAALAGTAAATQFDFTAANGTTTGTDAGTFAAPLATGAFGNVEASFAGSLTGEFSGGSDAPSTGNITLNAVDGGAADGLTGNATQLVFTSGAATAASFDADTNILTVTVAEGDTVQDIADAIDADGTFTTSNVTDGTETYAATFNGNKGALGTTAGSITNNTAGTNPSAAATFALEAVNGQGADGTTGNDTTLNFTRGTTGTTTATYDADTNVLNIEVGTDNTVDQIISAINTEGTFTVASGPTTNGNYIFSDTDLGANDPGLLGGSDGTLDDVLTITADATGTELNGATITFATDNSYTAGQVTAAADDDGNITITTDNTGTVQLSAVAAAISEIDGVTATISANAGDGIYDIDNDPAPTDQTFAGGVFGGGLTDDIVFELTGSTGSEVFEFDKGTSLDDIVQAINLVSDATGITASDAAGALKLDSNDYGSKSLVAIDVISEGADGTFESGLSSSRANGTDIVATVNGYNASGDGNTLSINTATLDLQLTVDDGSSTDVNFSITGGGALFQLGPDVVSNQQARLGIGSLNTAKLGGASGRLFELKSGGAKSLTSDISGAANIVEEVINKVTNLRGRLGAFQSTTLESNLVSLNDTVANLQQAESSIRDADFAAESANLTRAQILVQSGTNVLSLANQNPQNVLSLLR